MRIDAHIRALLPTDNRDAWRQLAKLQPGDRVVARVAAILDTGQAQVDLGGVRTTADVRIPVSVGDRLSLVVAAAGDTLHLRLATPADPVGARAAGPMTTETMAQLRDLIQAAGTRISASGTPHAQTELKQVLSQLMRHLAPLTLNQGAATVADRLQSLIQQSGLFFEKHLGEILSQPGGTRNSQRTEEPSGRARTWDAGGQHRLLNSDAKALLGRLAALTASNPSRSTPLVQLHAAASRTLNGFEGALDRLMAGQDRPLIYRAATPALTGDRPPMSLAGGRLNPPDTAGAAQADGHRGTDRTAPLARTLTETVARIQTQLDQWGKTATAPTGKPAIETAKAADALARALTDTAGRTGLLLKSTHAALGRLAASTATPADPNRLAVLINAVRAALTEDAEQIRAALDQLRRGGTGTSGDTAEARPAGLERGPEPGPSITFALPMAHTETPAHLRVYYRKKQTGADTTGDFRLSLLLCLDSLGDVRCDFRLNQGQLDINFFAARESARARIAAETERLEPLLADRFERLAITTATHPQRAAAFDPTPVDVGGSPGGLHVRA